MGNRIRVGACLSLSGKFGQFGRQAARGLEAWRSLYGEAELVVEDDRTDRHVLDAVSPSVAARCGTAVALDLGVVTDRRRAEAAALAGARSARCTVLNR